LQKNNLFFERRFNVTLFLRQKSQKNGFFKHVKSESSHTTKGQIAMAAFASAKNSDQFLLKGGNYRRR